jgi:hypothetical protein
MSLQHAAKHLASHGRGPDTELVHMTKGEINSLQTLAKANGGSLTINPHTGLAEAGFLSKLLPMAIGAGLAYATGGTSLAATGGLFGMGMPATIGMGMGALQTARTGSLQKGLMAGLGAYGGAGLAGGLMGAGAANLGNTAASGAYDASLQSQGLNAAQAGMDISNPLAEQAAASARTAATASNLNNLSAGASGLGNQAGRGAFMQQMGGGSGLFKTGLAATAPMLMGGEQQPQTPIGDSTMPQRLVFESGVASPYPAADSFDYNNPGRDFGRQRSYFPNAGYRQISQEEAKKLRGYAGGGPVEAMSNANAIGANTGFPMANINKPSYATPFQTPISQNVVQGSADADVNSMTGEMNEFAEGGDVQLQGRVTIDDQGSQGGQFGKALDNGYRPMGGASLIDQRVMNGGLREQGMTAGFGGQNGQANPFSDAMPQGMAQQNLQMAMQRGEAVPPANDPYATPLLRHCGIGMATGGTSYAQGGMSHLGDYSDGGRLLKGPGDGVSDSIPATIGNKQPARLADGEFVVPARIVSELGNGSTEAGARKLYAMLDRVQQARGKTVGKGKVAKNTRADKLLPA